MALKWVSRVCATLLLPLLFATVAGWAASQTFLSTHYVEHTLQQQNAYQRLSDAISTDVAKSTDDTLTEGDVASQLQKIISPSVVHSKVSGTLQQVNDYYKNGGPVPTLDVSDLLSQASAAGIPIQSDDKLAKPITIQPAVQAKKYNNLAKGLSIGFIVAEVVLLLTMVVIAIKRHDFRPLAVLLIWLGALLTLPGALLMLAPHVLSRAPAVKSLDSAFASLGRDILFAFIRDFGLRLLAAGLISLVVGIVWRVLIHKATQQALQPVAVPMSASPAPAPLPLATPVIPPAAPSEPRQPVTGAPPVLPSQRKPKRPRLIQ